MYAHLSLSEEMYQCILSHKMVALVLVHYVLVHCAVDCTNRSAFQIYYVQQCA